MSLVALVWALSLKLVIKLYSDGWLLITEKRQQTSFETGINKTTWVLIRFMLVITPTVFLINGLTKAIGWKR